MPDPVVISILTRFLARSVKDGSKTRDDLTAISLDCFAKMQKGVTLTSTSFDGGGASSVVNCHPADLMAAAEEAFIITDPDNPAMAMGTKVVHADLSRTRIEI